MNRKLLAAFATLVSMAWGPVQADIITLDDWNVTEIEDSGDVVTVNISEVRGNTVLTVQWVEGSTSDDLWTAIGLDQFYFNSTAAVSSVYEVIGSTSSLVSWTQSEGGQAGGFGRFLSWEREGGSTGGIDPGYIVFTFSGTTTFGVNARGNQFAAHVRYGDAPEGFYADAAGGCSGFVGGPDSTTGSESNSKCGATEVPEPATLALFGLGLIGFGIARRRKS